MGAKLRWMTGHLLSWFVVAVIGTIGGWYVQILITEWR